MDRTDCPIYTESKKCFKSRKSVFICICGWGVGLFMLAAGLFLSDEMGAVTSFLGIIMGIFLIVLPFVHIKEKKNRLEILLDTLCSLSAEEYSALCNEFSHSTKAGTNSLYIMSHWIFCGDEPFLMPLKELKNFSIRPVYRENGGKVESFELKFHSDGKTFTLNYPANSGIDPQILGTEIQRRLDEAVKEAANAAPLYQSTGYTAAESKSTSFIPMNYERNKCPVLAKCKTEGLFSPMKILQIFILGLFTAGSLYVTVNTESTIYMIGMGLIACVSVIGILWTIFYSLRGYSETKAFLSSLSPEDYGRLVSSFRSADGKSAVMLLDGFLLVPSLPLVCAYKDIDGVNITKLYYNGVKNGHKVEFNVKGKKREATFNNMAEFDPDFFKEELNNKMQMMKG